MTKKVDMKIRIAPKTLKKLTYMFKTNICNKNANSKSVVRMIEILAGSSCFIAKFKNTCAKRAARLEMSKNPI